MRIEYHLATPEDVDYIAWNLREADRIEVELATGLHAHEAVIESAAHSRRTWVATSGDAPVAIFGIGEASPTVGTPWMLGTSEIVKYQRELVRDGRSVVEDMQKAYPCLLNCVHLENTMAIRWLAHLGFSFDKPIPYGPKMALFIPFYRYSNV